jgi:hypothetical protein
VLDLDAPAQTVAGVDLAADEADSTRWYVLPPPPRVARVDGRPDLTLLRLVEDGALTGGHLHLAVELARDPASLEAARSALADEHRKDITLVPVPVQTGSAELMFLGRETDADGGLGPLIRRDLGRTPVGLMDPHRAAFSIPLTPEGATLMEAALRSGGAPVGVAYRLGVEGLWPAQRVVARIDWGRVYDHLSVHLKDGRLLWVEDVQKLSEELVEDRSIVIDAVQGLAPGTDDAVADLGPALAWVQREIVERFCEPVMPLSREPARASLGTMGEVFGVGTAFAARKLTQIERATTTIDLQVTSVVGRTLTVQAHLADLLGDASPDDHIADAGLDHPFFRRFELHVGTCLPLADLHVQEAVAHIAYGTHDESVRLTADQPDGAMAAWADASPDRSWTVRPELTFAADAPLDPGALVALAELTGRSRELTLDLEDLLGLVRPELRGPVDPRVVMTSASVTHRRDGVSLAERDAALTPAAPAQTVWFRDHRPGDRIEVATKHLLGDGRIVEPAPILADTRVVLLPPPFPGSMTVQVLSEDDWTGLDVVTVALQKAVDLPTGTFSFDGPGKGVAVALDLPDPSDRTYRYRVTRTWGTGEAEEDDWVQSDASVLVVGRVAANRLVVDVTPLGPELPDAGVVLIEVELSYLDPEHQVRDEQKVVIGAWADRFRWEVAIADPLRRTYRYRVTTHRTSGATDVGPWTTSSERILPIPITRAQE